MPATKRAVAESKTKGKKKPEPESESEEEIEEVSEEESSEESTLADDIKLALKKSKVAGQGYYNVNTKKVVPIKGNEDKLVFYDLDDGIFLAGVAKSEELVDALESLEAEDAKPVKVGKPKAKAAKEEKPKKSAAPKPKEKVKKAEEEIELEESEEEKPKKTAKAVPKKSTSTKVAPAPKPKAAPKSKTETVEETCFRPGKMDEYELRTLITDTVNKYIEELRTNIIRDITFGLMAVSLEACKARDEPEILSEAAQEPKEEVAKESETEEELEKTQEFPEEEKKKLAEKSGKKEGKVKEINPVNLSKRGVFESEGGWVWDTTSHTIIGKWEGDEVRLLTPDEIKERESKSFRVSKDLDNDKLLALFEKMEKENIEGFKIPHIAGPKSEEIESEGKQEGPDDGDVIAEFEKQKEQLMGTRLVPSVGKETGKGKEEKKSEPPAVPKKPEPAKEGEISREEFGDFLDLRAKNTVNFANRGAVASALKLPLEKVSAVLDNWGKLTIKYNDLVESKKPTVPKKPAPDQGKSDKPTVKRLEPKN